MSTKINRHQAKRIGEHIAEKAFEHLVNPLVEQNLAFAIKANAQFFANFSPEQIALMEKADLITKTKSIRLMVVKTTDDCVGISYTTDTEYYNKNGWGDLEIHDDQLYEECRAREKQLQELRYKKASMAYEISAQCQGKNPNTVMKNWPEAASIIESVVGTENTSSPTLTVPLGVLLARFLPMLPAPQED